MNWVLPLLIYSCFVHSSKLKSSEGDEDDDKGNKETRRRNGDDASRNAGSRGAMRRMEDVNCPDGCRCNTSSIGCRRLNGREPFTRIRPLAFPVLDTLVATGGQLGDLSNYNLFGVGQSHARLSFLNLSSNHITAVSAHTFAGVPKVEFLYLDDNEMTSLSRNPFGHLSRLNVLGLRRSLRRVDGDALRKVFEARSGSLTHLTNILLDENGLTEVHADTFCRVEGLIHLSLQNNLLESFSVTEGCVPGLKILLLAGNRLKTLSGGLWQVMPSLNSVDISENPLECDCALSPLIRIAERDSHHFLNQGKTTCGGPRALSGADLFHLESDLCASSSNVSLYILIAILVIGILAVVVRRAHSRQILPPFLQFRYSSLNQTEEAQFV